VGKPVKSETRIALVPCAAVLAVEELSVVCDAKALTRSKRHRPVQGRGEL